MNWLLSLFDDRTFGSARSSEWPTFRKKHLDSKCAVCGTSWGLELHHKIPVHVDPSKELDSNNVLTLCGWTKNNCHLRWGHLWSFRSYNPKIDEWIKIKNNRP